jgi:hypothetical protein
MSFRMCSSIFRVFREIFQMFLEIILFFHRPKSNYWKALKSFSWAPSFLEIFGILQDIFFVV